MTSKERQHPSKKAAMAVGVTDSTPSSSQTGALSSQKPAIAIEVTESTPPSSQSSALGSQKLLEAQTDIEGPAQRGFNFFQLPPEIRNRIYHLIFVKPGYIGSEGTLTKAFYSDAAKWRNLAFTRCCRQVYNESADIFYAKNGFEFFYIRPFLEFIEAIGIKRRMLLTKIKFHHTKGTPFIALRYLKSCKNLKEVGIYARCIKKNTNSCWEYPMENAKGFFLGSHSSIKYGEVLRFGKAIASDEYPGEGKCGVKMSLFGSLVKVKREEYDLYKR